MQRSTFDNGPQLSDRQWEAFFNLSLDLLCVAGFDGYFKRLNHAWSATLGYTPQALMSRPLLDFVHEDDRAITQAEMEKIIRGEATAYFENRFIAQDGQARWLLWSASAHPEQGQIYAVGRDITDRKLVEFALARNTQISEAVRALQSQYIAADNPHTLLENTLQTLLRFTESEYGLIAEIAFSDKGTPYFETCAFSECMVLSGWPFLDEENILEELQAYRIGEALETLIASGQALIDNHVDRPLSPGLPPLRSFLAIPLHFGEQLLGMVWVGKGTAAYQRTLPDQIAPLLGSCANLIHALRDDRRRHNAEENLRQNEVRLRTILDTVADGIITIDNDGRIETFNSAAERIFGYRAEEVLGDNVNILMPEPYHGAHDGYLNNYKRTHEAKVIGIGREVSGRRKDGSTFPLDLTISEMRMGNELKFAGVVRDITERKKIERMKGEFISTVSHELRTPLTSIRGSLGLIAGGAAGELGEQAKTLIDIACNNSDRLVRLINDILDIEKIEAGKMLFNLKSQALAPLIEQTVEANEGYAAQHGVRIEFRDAYPGCQARVDGDRLIQVITNLISNAVKYSPAGGVVGLRLEHHGPLARVSVQDQGPGIAEEFRERIFQKFVQADSTDSRQKGGTGLGLSISKAIVEHMGGKIGFESTTGKGSSYFFHLPARASGGRAPRPARKTGREPGERPRILICEDEPDIAHLLHIVLHAEGYAPSIAHDAEHAKALLAEVDFAAMTLDLMLPEQDGISLIRELRQQESTRDLPIVVVSAKAGAGQDALNGGAMGVIDWLGKPIDQAQLLNAVKLASEKSASHKPVILHVEDDTDLQDIIAAILGDTATVIPALNLRQARSLIAERTFDLVILDIQLPDGSGTDLLASLQSTAPSTPVIIFSSHDVDRDAANAVSSVLIKSRTSNNELLNTIQTLIATRGKQAPRRR